MKKNLFLILLSLLSFSCSSAAYRFSWPETAQTVRAYCELDISSRLFSFSGYATLRMDPSQFYAEILDSFSTTLMILKKEGDKTTLVSADEMISEAFGTLLFPFEDVIEDIRKAQFYLTKGERVSLDKKYYRVTYDPTKRKPSICWNREDGSMCITFLDVQKI